MASGSALQARVVSTSATFTSRLRLLPAALIILSFVSLFVGCSRDAAARRYDESGQRYFAHQQFAEAYIQFRNALEYRPQSYELHYKAALAAIQLKQFDNADRELSATVELQPSFVPARLELANVLLLLRDTARAREQISAVQRSEPQNLRAQTLLAKTYLVDEDYERAVVEWEKATKLAPDDPLLWTSLGFAHIAANNYSAAESQFRHAIVIDPSFEEGHRNLANCLRLLGKNGEAEALLQQAIKLNPKALDSQLALADLYLEENRAAEVDALFAAAQQHALDFENLPLQIGDFWWHHNELARAAQAYERERAARPSHFIDKKLILVYLNLQRISEARALNDGILRAQPKDFEARVFDGALAYVRHDSQSAAKGLSDLVKEDPESLVANYYLALSLLELNQPIEAEHLLRRCTEILPEFAQSYLRLSEIAARNNDLSTALDYARAAAKVAPASAEVQLQLAEIYLRRGDSALADRILGGVDARQNLPTRYYELCARASALRHDDKRAELNLRRALQLTDEPVVLLSRHADALVELHQQRLAITEVEHWLSSHEGDVAGHELLARLYLNDGNLAKADIYSRTALRREPDRWLPHFLLGEIARKRGQHAQAVAEYEEAIRLRPHEIPLYLFAGRALEALGRTDAARRMFETARTRDPASPHAKYALASWYADHGTNLDVALTLAQELRAQSPQEQQVVVLLGWICYQKGLYTLALQQFQLAAGNLTDDATLQYRLGLVYLRTGKPDDARKSLHRAIALGLQPPEVADDAQRTLAQLARN